MAFLIKLKRISYKASAHAYSFLTIFLSKKREPVGSLFFCVFFFCSSAFAQVEADQTEYLKLEPIWSDVLKQSNQKGLAFDSEWLQLLHMTCSGSDCKSLEDGIQFFISKEGRKNPKQELEATIKAFENNTLLTMNAAKVQQNARCQYPARLSFLAKHTGGWSYQALLAGCKDYQNYREKLGTEVIKLVFSSYYLNNPSSAFGHSFLKVSKFRKQNDHSVKSDLLDYGINYAAIPTTSNALLYGVMGMVGGFRGEYAKIPYYFKVREYSDYESRDLWEYPLKLRESEKNLFLEHLWEMGQAAFDYFYFDENCSYYILRVLDVAAPRYKVLEGLPPWIIPIDTIKQAIQKGMVDLDHIGFRPSLSTIVSKRYNLLNDDEKSLFHEFRGLEKSQIKGITAPALDAVLDDFDMQNLDGLIKKDPSTLKKKHVALLTRSQMESDHEKKIAGILRRKPSNAPHESHESMRWTLGYRGLDLENSFKEHQGILGVRVALHDFLDPVFGMPTYSRLEMMLAEFYIDNKGHRIHLERLRLVGIEARNSFGPLWHKPLWQIDMGFDRIRDPRCFNCLAGGMIGGIGISKNFTKSFVFQPYAKMNIALQYADAIESGFTYDYWGEAGLRVNTPSDFNFMFASQVKFYEDRFKEFYYRHLVGIQLPFSKNLGIRLQGVKSPYEFQAQAAIAYYH